MHIAKAHLPHTKVNFILQPFVTGSFAGKLGCLNLFLIEDAKMLFMRLYYKLPKTVYERKILLHIAKAHLPHKSDFSWHNHQDKEIKYTSRVGTKENKKFGKEKK